MPAILSKIREQASRVQIQPSLAVGVGVGVALAACALYGTREKKQSPPCNNNNNYKVSKNGKIHCVQNGQNGQPSSKACSCAAEQCALCRGDADTENKQNVEDTEEPHEARASTNVPGLNLQFLKQLMSLARIMIPGVRSHEVALLSAHTLCLFSRTFLSIYVASLEGSIVKHIVNKDLRSFMALLIQWFSIAVPATFINSMIRYLEGKLALAFRTRLVNHAYGLYFKNQTYYRVSNLDARIENADHRLTEDVSVFTSSVAHLYSSLTKPCFDLLLIVLTLASYSSNMKGNIFIGPGFSFIVICITGQLLRLLSPKFGALAGEEARMKANLRHAHSRLIAHAEEVAFYGGHKVELEQLQTAYGSLVSQMTVIFNKKLWYVMLEQFFMKYVWSGTGMVMLALPILTGKGDGTSEGISARTEYMTTSRNLLNSAADAIERLMSSYKEIVTLAGYSERVWEMLRVFSEVAKGQCVRAVHSQPAHGFAVTFRNGVPQPNGKIEYTNDLSISLEKVPIVTPACDIVASVVTLEIRPGTHLLIIGPNGCGKSSLFRIISGLWPVFGGLLRVPAPCACAACCPSDAGDAPATCSNRPVMFYIPQRPYMSVGTLIDQVTYPSRVDPGDQESAARAWSILRLVRLDACARRHGGLAARSDWRSTLSGGEKQRMAMARMFYHRKRRCLKSNEILAELATNENLRSADISSITEESLGMTIEAQETPVYALLDECTSAVSMETEVVMYEAAVREGITLLSITHRPSVWKYHTHVLEFDGAGNWAFKPLHLDKLEKDTPTSKLQVKEREVEHDGSS